jgi:hypothetical protein
MLKQKPKRIYYRSRQEALVTRVHGSIKYDADEMAYYIVDTEKKSNIDDNTRRRIGDVILLVGSGLAVALLFYGSFIY